MKRSPWQRPLAALVLSACAWPALAVPFVDASNDYVTGYNGSKLGDLDVIEAEVLYNIGTHAFTFEARVAAPVGTTSTGFYVWGVNRGAGTAGFAGNGVGGVLFDTVVIMRQDHTVTVNRLGGGGTTVLTNAVSFSGDRMTATIDGALLPTRGFTADHYTWNLWPRDSTQSAGFPQISDFAPDNSNLTVTSVPEPAQGLMLGAGLLALLFKRAHGRQRTRRA